MYQTLAKQDLDDLDSSEKPLEQILGNKRTLQIYNQESAAPIQCLNSEGKFTAGSPGKYVRPASTEVLQGADSGNDTALLPHGTYHHIVSFNHLAEFWDRMIDNCQEDITHIQRILRQVVMMYQLQVRLENSRVRGRRKSGTPRLATAPEETDTSPTDAALPEVETFPQFAEDVDEDFESPRDASTVTINELLNFVNTLTPETLLAPENVNYLSLIATMYTWMPFNLVLGPVPKKGVLILVKYSMKRLPRYKAIKKHTQS